jgi:CRP-like cAMP-binding protein
MDLQKLEKDFKGGSVLFREGDSNREMYIIHSGRVCIKKQIGGEEFILAVFGPGDFFGEMATLMNIPRSANAEVLDDSRLLVIDPKIFEEVTSKRPEIMLKIMKGLAKRILETNRIIEGLMLRDDFARIIHELLRLMGEGETEGDHGVRFALTIAELSRELDIDISKVRGILEQLNRTDVIEILDNSYINIMNSAKLRNYMDFLLRMEGEG